MALPIARQEMIIPPTMRQILNANISGPRAGSTPLQDAGPSAGSSQSTIGPVPPPITQYREATFWGGVLTPFPMHE